MVSPAEFLCFARFDYRFNWFVALKLFFCCTRADLIKFTWNNKSTMSRNCYIEIGRVNLMENFQNFDQFSWYLIFVFWRDRVSVHLRYVHVTCYYYSNTVVFYSCEAVSWATLYCGALGFLQFKEFELHWGAVFFLRSVHTFMIFEVKLE